jgi:uncharacterized membrane protein
MMASEKPEDSTTKPDKEQLSFLQMMMSVIQASFGVQNQKNRERDFEKGSIGGFIGAALIFTVLFVLSLVVVVNLVLP